MNALFSVRTRACAASTLLCASMFLLSTPQSGQAQALPTYPTTDGAPSTTSWTIDRYRPANFFNGGTLNGRQNVLVLGVNEADGPGNRPPAQSSTFFDTQGRKLRVLNWGTPPISFVGSVYIPSAWALSTGLSDSRRTDMWGVLTPNGVTDLNSALFAIIGFANEAPPTTAFSNTPSRLPADTMPDGGGVGRYRVFDGDVGAGFVDLAVPVMYDRWTDLCISYIGNAIEYRLNDQIVYTDNTINVPVMGTPTPVRGFLEVIMQAKNYGQRPVPPGGIAGVTYDTNWSSLAFGNGTCDQVGINGQFGSDLQITKTASPASVTVGQNVTFTLTVTNNGPAPATAVRVTDTLPAGLNYISTTCAGATFASPVLTWPVGNLANGASASCTLTAQVTAPGTLTNTATVQADQTDPVTVNNNTLASVGAAVPIALPASNPSATWLLLGLMLLSAGVVLRRAD